MKDTILIIDDDSTTCTILSDIVKNLGFSPLVAEGGHKGIITLKSHHQDICAVLLDIYMPCIDGISVLGEVRSHYPELPVVIISGSTDPEKDELASQKLGADGYIRKPIAPNVIQQKLTALLDAA